jgi:hypothetical protein
MSGRREVKHRKVISVGQLAILKLLHKYRFGSIELLRVSLGLNVGPGLYKKLEILCDQDYVGKRYDSSYRIKGIPAAYHLLPKGYRVLQGLPEYQSIDDKLVKYSYRDKTTKQPFIGQILQVYIAALELTRLYPSVKLFTKRELVGRKHFPSRLPDAFVSLKPEDNKKPYRYFLDVIPDGEPRYKIDKKIADYFDFFDGGGWEATNSALPVMLLLCESVSFERRVQRLVARKLDSLGSDEPEYFTSTLKALKNAGAGAMAIWSNVEDPEEPYDLEATQLS